MRVYSQADYDNFTTFEKAAQGAMDDIYMLKGYTSDRGQACIGYDTIISGLNGSKSWRVEEKFRRDDYGDFGIELLQDVVTCARGWAYYTTAEIINYVICDSNDVPDHGYYVDWPKFKMWLEQHLRANKKQQVFISDLGKGLTLNLSVAWSVIPSKLYIQWRLG